MAADIRNGANDLFDMGNMNFQDLVAAELLLARAKYPEPFVNARDGIKVIQEELTETMVKVFKMRPNDDIMHDLVQVAAMCQRTAEDCKLMATHSVRDEEN